MNKYKIGDRVQIRSKEWYDENKEVDESDETLVEAPSDYSQVFIEDMSGFCGMRTRIAYIDSDGLYRLDIDNESWLWEDWMFEDQEWSGNWDYNEEAMAEMNRGYIGRLRAIEATKPKLVINGKAYDIETDMIPREAAMEAFKKHCYFRLLNGKCSIDLTECGNNCSGVEDFVVDMEKSSVKFGDVIK